MKTSTGKPGTEGQATRRPGARLSGARLLGAVALLGIWQLAAWSINSELILPSPGKTLSTLIRLLPDPDFLAAVGGTLVNVALAFISSLAAGFILGLAAGLVPGIGDFLSPLLTTIRATPVMALILVALFWFESSLVAIFSAFLMAFPVVYTSVRGGVRSISPDLVEMSDVFKVPGSQRIRHLLLPGIAPMLASGAASCMGLSWKVVVAGEILAQPRSSLGSLMQDSRLSLETPRVLALASVVVILCGASEFILARLTRRLESRYAERLP